MYCRLLQGELSAIFLTFIKLPFVIKVLYFVFFEWPIYSGFTVAWPWKMNINAYNPTCVDCETGTKHRVGAQWLSGRVLDLRPRDRGSSLTGFTVLCS